MEPLYARSRSKCPMARIGLLRLISESSADQQARLQSGSGRSWQPERRLRLEKRHRSFVADWSFVVSAVAPRSDMPGARPTQAFVVDPLRHSKMLKDCPHRVSSRRRPQLPEVSAFQKSEPRSCLTAFGPKADEQQCASCRPFTTADTILENGKFACMRAARRELEPGETPALKYLIL